MKVLVCTAHPDDETLWAGGYLAAHPGTHVACCCIDRRDHARTERFFQACAVLEAVPFVVAGDFELWGLDTRPIEAFAATYDAIITHNERGEYGHPAHIKLHHAMRGLGKPMRVFNYGVTLGEPIDLGAKLKALECYRDDKLLPWLRKHFGFNLGREELLDLPYRRPCHYGTARPSGRLHARPTSRGAHVRQAVPRGGRRGRA